MKLLHKGYVVAPVLSASWLVCLSLSVCILLSFFTGEVYKADLILAIWLGLGYGFIFLISENTYRRYKVSILLLSALVLTLYGPLENTSKLVETEYQIGANALTSLCFTLAVWKTLSFLPIYSLTRHEFEDTLIRFLTGFGYLFFTAIVAIPFYVMIMTSLKNQSELLFNPLDFSIDFSKGSDLFRSYFELFSTFNFGNYLAVSFVVSTLTVIITLLFYS